jgi:formylmethanofuran dehydrogenase subunit E
MLSDLKKIYTETHLPLATEKLRHAVKITARNLVAPPGDAPPDYYKVEEIYYPSGQAYEASLDCEATKEVAANARAISSGGRPVSLICYGEQENWVFSPGGLKI